MFQLDNVSQEILTKVREQPHVCFQLLRRFVKEMVERVARFGQGVRLIAVEQLPARDDEAIEQLENLAPQIIVIARKGPLHFDRRAAQRASNGFGGRALIAPLSSVSRDAFDTSAVHRTSSDTMALHNILIVYPSDTVITSTRLATCYSLKSAPEGQGSNLGPSGAITIQHAHREARGPDRLGAPQEKVTSRVPSHFVLELILTRSPA
jgi:hypothetical protein